jgi:hypothetical protein
MILVIVLISPIVMEAILIIFIWNEFMHEAGPILSWFEGIKDEKTNHNAIMASP